MSHPNPPLGFCCTTLTTITSPPPLCPNHQISTIPLPQLLRALYSQSSPSPERIYSIHRTSLSADKNISSGCGYFISFSSQGITNYITYAMYHDQPRCIQLNEPFECWVQWVKVEELKYVLKCEVSGRSYEVQVWADPAFLGARVLVGEGIKDEKTGGTFLFVEE
ncbi:hypothetical protein NA56DRAFT_644710 [Hyaloscypha hepaticicola]|uniref:Uncharacterized protein n=1 Tax=Hyaloscypha hepaticicola TaxID=2082293 RepID=A0A2J6Q8A7_9HELO|nr:hypothetical protein NA56DRAFT_644710 [Hyaloscypha hepaticicola]